MKNEIKKTVELVKQEIDSQVALYDEDSDQLFQFDPTSQQAAWNMYDAYKQFDMMRRYVLCQIKERKYYLVYGFKNFNAFRKANEISKITAFRDVKIGELMVGESEKGSTGGTFLPDVADRIEELGATKVYELMRFGNEAVKALLVDGSMIFDDGELTFDEVKSMSKNDLAKAITRAAIDGKSESISALKAEIAKVNAEKKILKRERDDALKQAQRGQQLEDKYGATNATVQGKIRDLNLAHQSFSDFLRYVNKADIRPDDPEVLVDLLETLTGSFMTYYEENIDRLKAVVYQARGDMPFDDEVE